MARMRPRAVHLRLGVAALAVAAASLPSINAGATSKASASSTARLQLLRAGPLSEQQGVGRRREGSVHGLQVARRQLRRTRLSPLHELADLERRLPQGRLPLQLRDPDRGPAGVAIKEAHSFHLRVLLRPLLDETNLQQHGGWRGSIKPSNVRLWFKSYLARPDSLPRVAHSRESSTSRSPPSSTAWRRRRTGRGSSRARSTCTTAAELHDQLGADRAGKVAWAGRRRGWTPTRWRPSPTAPPRRTCSPHGTTRSQQRHGAVLDLQRNDRRGRHRRPGRRLQPAVGLEPPGADPPVQPEHPGELVLDGLQLLPDARDARHLLLGCLVHRRCEWVAEDAGRGRAQEIQPASAAVIRACFQ